MITKPRKETDLCSMIRKLEVRIGEAGTDLARLRLEAYVKSCKKLGIKTALQLNSVKRVYLEALEEVARGATEQPINDERIEFWERRDFSHYRTTTSLGTIYR